MANSPRLHRLALVLIVAWYLLATLPRLANFPIIETAQMGIAAPAYKLASEGVYGNDLYRGFHRAEQRNYDHMPLYPLTLALVFKLLELGVWQGRILSVLCGLATLLLTYRLGRRLDGPHAGLLATAVLAALPIAAAGQSAGPLYPGTIPHLDFARVMRYDVMVPVWALAACLLVWHGQDRRSSAATFLAGVAAGLATLSHLYGAFVLAPLAWVLLDRRPLDRPAIRSLLWLLAGWLAALLPWVIYVLQDLPAYRGQMLRHESKFDLLNPRFYLDNLAREPWRYVKFIGFFRTPALWPRPGFWVMIVSLLSANLLWGQRRRALSREARFLLVALPMLALLLALLISFKRYAYITLLLPFLALQIAAGLRELWRRAGGRRPWARTALLLALAAALVEGVVGVVRNLQVARETTPYLEVTSALREQMPAGSRLVMLHAYWLGLADYDAYALDLIYFLASPNLDYERPLTVAEAIDAIAPDYLLTRRALRTAYLHPPLDPATAALAERLAAVDAYLAERCAPVTVGPPDPDYGAVELFACAGR